MLRLAIFALVTILYFPFVTNGTMTPGTIPQPHTIRRLAFVGNSLTVAGPMPAYQWYGYWGMAATQPDKDYVHRVQLKLAASNGYISEIGVFSADLHTPDLISQAANSVSAFAPDVLVVEMGDNAAAGTSYEKFRDAYTQLRDAAPKTKLFYVGTWQAGETFNQYIQQIAAEDNATYVAIDDIYADKMNQASAQGCTDTHGVCWHPSNAGMELIAAKIFNAIKE